MNTEHIHEDAVPAGGGDAPSTNTVGTGKIAGTTGSPPMGIKAMRKYKNKNREDEINMDRRLYGDLAPEHEGDDEEGEEGYAGGKSRSHGQERGYRELNRRYAPKTHHEHAKKIMKRLLGRE